MSCPRCCGQTRQVTSPGRIKNPTPNSAWERYTTPAHARRSETASASDTTLGPDIGVDHASVARDLVQRLTGPSLPRAPHLGGRTLRPADCARPATPQLAATVLISAATGAMSSRARPAVGSSSSRNFGATHRRRFQAVAGDHRQIRGPAFKPSGQPALIEKMPDPCFMFVLSRTAAQKLQTPHIQRECRCGYCRRRRDLENRSISETIGRARAGQDGSARPPSRPHHGDEPGQLAS